MPTIAYLQPFRPTHDFPWQVFFASIAWLADWSPGRSQGSPPSALTKIPIQDPARGFE